LEYFHINYVGWMMGKQLAWHFVGKKLRDGRPVPRNGVWLEHKGEIAICASGLHASLNPFDALQYAPGPVLCLVEVDGVEEKHNDKLVCRRRKIVARMDATEMLCYFARMQAVSVIDEWDAPDVVCDYLMTGDKSLRDAAWDATWDAAWDAARDAARKAVWAAAWGAAWDAARDAAWAAARYAARDAARKAAWNAARDGFTQLVHECFENYLNTTRGVRNERM
jgi:hypothetical protein